MIPLLRLNQVSNFIESVLHELFPFLLDSFDPIKCYLGISVAELSQASALERVLYVQSQ